MLKGGASIMDKMIEEIEVTYALEPIILLPRERGPEQASVDCLWKGMGYLY